MPESMAAAMMYAGDIFNSHTAMTTTRGIHAFFREIPADLLNPVNGAAIKATTAGRIPLKIRSTIGLFLNCVKIMAMKRIVMKEGRMMPKPENKLPLNPNRLLPTNKAVFNAMGPGMD